VKTQSAHWLASNPFQQGIEGFIAEEKRMIDDYYADCVLHSPYQTTL